MIGMQAREIGMIRITGIPGDSKKARRGTPGIPMISNQGPIGNPYISKNAAWGSSGIPKWGMIVPKRSQEILKEDNRDPRVPSGFQKVAMGTL